jgi:hypothetical protein
MCSQPCVVTHSFLNMLLLLDDVMERVNCHLGVRNLAALCLVTKTPLWSTLFARRQTHLREKLIHGVAQEGDLWCWIHPPLDQCKGWLIKREGTIARLMVHRGRFNVFRGFESFFNPDRHETYLIHDEECKVRWVGCGTNANGGWLCGEELEQEVQRPSPPSL